MEDSKFDRFSDKSACLDLGQGNMDNIACMKPVTGFDHRTVDADMSTAYTFSQPGARLVGKTAD